MSLEVHSFGNADEPFIFSQVFVLPSFTLADVDTPCLNAICQQNPHLIGIKFPQLLHNQTGLIVGRDNFDLIKARTVFKGDSNSKRANLPDIGWTIGGPHDSRYQQPTFHATTFQCLTTFNEDHNNDYFYKLLASV